MYIIDMESMESYYDRPIHFLHILHSKFTDIKSRATQYGYTNGYYRIDIDKDALTGDVEYWYMIEDNPFFNSRDYEIEFESESEMKQFLNELKAMLRELERQKQISYHIDEGENRIIIDIFGM